MRKLTLLVCFLAAAAVSWAQNQQAQLQNDGDGDYVLIPADGSTSELDLTGKSLGYSIKIYDASGPNADYDNNWEGKLLITVPTGCVIHLSGTVITESTSFDWLEVYDGASDESTKLGDKFGSPENSEENAVNVTGSSQNMLLFFLSDGSNVDAGVDLTATFVVKDGDFVYADNAKTNLLKYIGEGGTVTIPSTATTINGSAFKGCNNLEYNTDGGLNYIGSSTNQYLFLVGPTSTDIAECTINSNTKFIGSEAFKNCSNLETINVPSTVVSISDYAFAYCDALTEITIPATVETIGEGAFSGIINVNYPANGTAADVNDDNWGAAARNGVIDGDFVFNAARTILIKYFGDDEEVVIPGTVTEIAANAFNDCDVIETVDFSQATGLTTIGDYAFADCDALTEITIPATVETIGEGAFSGIANVNYPANGTAADVNDDNWGASTRNGVVDGDFVFNADRTVLVKYIGDGEEVVIPSTVTEIADEAFIDCDYVETVDFSQATGLTTIGVRAFTYCYALTSITIPASVETIGDEAFSECNYLKTVDLSSATGLTTIGDYAFANCDVLQQITILASVEIIGAQAFYDCDNLKTVDLSGAESLSTIGDGAFFHCYTLTSIAIPASVETIGEEAFYDCNNLTTVDLSGATGLRTIGQSAFAECSIISVVVPETVTTIGVSAFSNVNNINYTGTAADEYSDNWGAAVRNGQVGNFIYSDSEHKNLVGCTVTHGSVEIPAGVEYIGNNIFKNNVNVSVTIPSSVTAIESEAFNGVANIINNSNYHTNEPWGAKNNNKTVDGDFVYADNTKTTIVGYIGEGGSIEIPAGVGAIGDYAFSDSWALTAVDFSKTTGLSIGDYAFSGCGLTEVTIPANVSSLGIVIFGGNTNLALINCEFSVAKSSEVSANNWFWQDGSGNSYPVRWQCNDWQLSDDGVLTVKANINYDSYNYYPWHDFSSQIESVEFASNVTAIGNNAFNDCDALTEITIPATVLTMGNNVFSGCENLSIIYCEAESKPAGWDDEWNNGYFPSCGWRRIPTLMDYKNLSLSDEGVLTINKNYNFEDADDYPWYYLSGQITAVEFASNVTAIGAYAFNDCDALTEITIPATVQSIGAYAFYDCAALTEITIPATVLTMGNNVFSGCENLSIIYCEAESKPAGWDDEWNNGYFPSCGCWRRIPTLMDCKNLSFSDEGVLTVNKNYNFENADDYPWYYLRGQITAVEFTNNVTAIGNNAFYDCGALAEVAIPSSVTTIGDWAFYNCDALESIDMSGATRLTTIGNNAFYDCSALESIDMSGATGLIVIGVYAFYNCDALTSVAIPASVETIGEEAFRDCNNLETATLSSNSSLQTIGTRAFYGCNKLGNNNLVNAAGLESIGQQAFYDCDGMTTVTIPASVTTIGSSVFQECSNLSVINCYAEKRPDGWDSYWNGSSAKVMWDFTNWSLSDEGVLSFNKNYNFENAGDYPWSSFCKQITGLDLGQNVTVIGNNAFYDCDALKSIDMSGATGLTTIGYFAFYDCDALAEITIPAGVRTIGNNAFNYCDALKTVDMTGATSLISIGSDAFYGCYKMVEISVPTSAAEIGNNAFYGIKNLIYDGAAGTESEKWGASARNGYVEGDFIYSDNTKTTLVAYIGNGGNVTIPASVQTIKDMAFYGCNTLTGVVVPAGVQTIGYEAFFNCTNLQTVDLSQATSLAEIYEEAFYNCTSLATIDLSKATGISQIRNNLFYNCAALTAITIPAGVESIGSSAFSECVNLQTVDLSGAESLTSIGDYAFADCGALTAITIPASVQWIDSYAFYDCDELATVNLSGAESLTSIGDHAFADCGTLAAITIPASVQWISSSAFYDCDELATVNLSGAESLTSIGDYAFANCGALATVDLSGAESLTSIGDYAFANCNTLETVDMSGATSLTTINIGSFANCDALETVLVPESLCSVREVAFDGCTSLNYNSANGFDYLGNSENSYIVLVKATAPGNVSTCSINSSVKVLATGAFEGCTDFPIEENGAYYIGNTDNPHLVLVKATSTDIDECTINSSTKFIAGRAFWDCENLAQITIPESVEGMGYGVVGLSWGDSPEVFCEACSLPARWDGYWNPYWGNPVHWAVGAWSLENGVLTVSKDIYLPNWDYYPWCQESNIQKVVFADGVTLVGYRAFYNNYAYYSRIEEVDFASTVESIGNEAFMYCYALETIDLNSVTTIGNKAFENCNNLSESLIIPASVTTMGSYVFNNCGDLTFFCEANSQPEEWNENWNPNGYPVIWHYNNINVSITSNNTTLGVVEITGENDEDRTNSGNGLVDNSFTYTGEWLSIVAVPNGDNQFVRWSDDETTEEHSQVRIEDDITLQAIFASSGEIYTVSVSYTGHGQVTGGSKYVEGETATLTAIPDEHYLFEGWDDGNTDNPRTVTVSGSDAYYEATFVGEPHNISITVEGSGSVGGDGTYPYNDYAYISATAADGWYFAQWLENGSNYNTSTECGFGVHSDRDFTAVFKQVQQVSAGVQTVKAYGYKRDNCKLVPDVTGTYTIYASSPNNEYVKLLDADKEQLAETESSDGRIVYDLEEGETYYIGVGNYSDYIENVTLYVMAPSVITVTANGQGEVTGSGAYTYGTNVTLTATAAQHHHFVKWSDNNTNSTRTITVTEDADYEAIFALDQHQVTVVAENGSTTSTGLYDWGEEITISATANTGHYFSKWADDATISTPSRTVTVERDTTYTAVFVPYYYDITTSVAAGEGEVSGAGNYAYGTTIKLTATPAETHHFVKWSDDVTDNPRTETVSDDDAFAAIFEINKFVVDLASTVEHGTVNNLGEYAHGTEVEFTATPASGYKFVRWSATEVANPYKVTITSDMTLAPVFVLESVNVYTITANAGVGGSVTGSGTYIANESATITAVPNSGYHFVKWSDGSTEAERTLTVNANGTYTATFEMDTYELKVVAGANGTVTGGGKIAYGGVTTISATANEGYHFVRWSDGNTSAERTITMNRDLTLTAEFAINTYAVTATAKNGKVEGAGTYNHGAEATLTAVANTGYHFTKWNDGVTTATRKVTVTSELSFTAEFEINSYTVTVSATNGTVEGAGTYTHGATATLNATAAEGYSFAQWSDGQKRAKRTVVVTCDTAFTAEFVANNYTVSASGTNGTVEGTGTYAYGAEATLTAVANTGYHFSKWSDGVETATRKVTVKSDLSFTAEFAADTYTISVVLDSAANGTITGAGTYAYGATATLEATANSGYHFVMWTDSVTTATRTIEVKGNATFSAVFAGNACELTVKAENGTVEGAGTYENGTEATLTAVADAGYIFSSWDDGNTDNPRTVTVTGNKTYTATFKKALYAVIVKAENGQITGAADSLELGATVTLTAIADEGYHFVMWSDRVTENPRTVVITAELLQQVKTDSIEFTAIFEKDNDNTAIADEAVEAVSIFAFDNTIVVENAASDIFVYDAMGRLINRTAAEAGRTEIQVNGAGVYIVKTGNTAKRVMIND